MAFGQERKSLVVAGIFIVAAFVLIGKLMSVQVFDDTYSDRAESGSYRIETIHPSRGLIYDRNGVVVVKNMPVYDIEVIPKKVKDLDTLLFCKTFDINVEEFQAKMDKAIKESRYKQTPFIRQLSPEEFLPAQEQLHKFPGFYAQVRTIRQYPYSSAPHLMGYLSEVNRETVKENEYYQAGDYHGVNGIEKTFEEILRGKKGKRYITVDAYGRDKSSFNNGSRDSEAERGKGLNLCIDLKLQTYIESLMYNKIGSLVAIEPATGEILALVSTPFYDPNLLTGSERSKNFSELNRNPLRPQLNRALQARYPPGSTLKPVVGLIGLAEEVINENYWFACKGYYQLSARRRLRCSHSHAPNKNIQDAIEQSCNPYFWTVFRKTIENEKYEKQSQALGRWVEYLEDFGMGRRLNIGLSNENPGNIPSVGYYDKIYGEGAWKASTIISLGIGQGEFAITPLQMAQFTATIANRGKAIAPHVVKREDRMKYRELVDEPFTISAHDIEIEKRHFDAVAKGMRQVVTDGTAKIAQFGDVEVCGKTGTAENPHGDDHSIFVGFAPLNNAEIAIAVVVENGGYGSRYAAPIASLAMEMYMHREIDESRKWLEDRMKDANLIEPILKAREEKERQRLELKEKEGE